MHRVQLTNVRVTCPQCGSVARVGDGIYRYANDYLTLKDGPLLTRQMLAQLESIAERAKKIPADSEQILAEVASVSPELAEKLRSKGMSYFVVVLILIWLVKSVNVNVTVDLNQLIDQATGAAETHDPSELLDAPLPSQPVEPNELLPSTSAATREARVSRQVRRQLERQSRKRSRRLDGGGSGRS